MPRAIAVEGTLQPIVHEDGPFELISAVGKQFNRQTVAMQFEIAKPARKRLGQVGGRIFHVIASDMSGGPELVCVRVDVRPGRGGDDDVRHVKAVETQRRGVRRNGFRPNRKVFASGMREHQLHASGKIGVAESVHLVEDRRRSRQGTSTTAERGNDQNGWEEWFHVAGMGGGETARERNFHSAPSASARRPGQVRKESGLRQETGKPRHWAGLAA